MEIKDFEKKEKNAAELSVWFSAEEFDKAVNSAYIKNRGRISVPGFRKGRAPRKLIENMYGPSVFYEDAMEILYPEGLDFGVKEKGLKTVGRPSVLDMNIGDDKTLTVKYGIALFPEVTLGEYKGLTAVKTTPKVLKKEVDDEIELARKRNARIVAVDREAKDGDTVVIDYEGFKDGTPFEGGKGEKYSLVLGSKQFIPGFEEQVTGMKAGETKEIALTFPENYQAKELAGKPVTFQVKVSEVRESILPELDDEFAKDVSEFDTLEAYKADVKEKISERKKTDAERAFKDAILEKLAENIQCEVPDAMVEERIDRTIENYNYNLSRQGLSFDKYLQMMGTTAADFRKTMVPGAEKELRLDLALEKIAETENFEITDEEIEKEYQTVAEKYGTTLENVKKAVSIDTVKEQLKTERAEKLVLDSAVAEKKTARKKSDEEKDDGKEEENGDAKDTENA